MFRPKAISRLIPQSVCLTAIFFLALLAPAAAGDFSGMTGRQILETIRSDFRAKTVITDRDRIMDILSSYARLSSGGFRDYFSEKPAAAIGGLEPLAVVPSAWWTESSPDRGLALCDLHNIVPANYDVLSIRGDFPPGVVSEAVFDNGFWKSGIGLVGSSETNFYEPAEGLKGDFARIYMFMAALYPQTLWCGRAPVLYLDGMFPLLTPYGRELLLGWHRSDPVDDFELRRDNIIAGAQGVSNPFVTDPALAEYVWGRYADQVYDPDPEEPVGPDLPPVSEPIMLKSVYSVSADRRIDFRSPYVAAGSAWAVDGVAVSSSSLSLDGLALGRHEISYSNRDSRGKIIITVEP